MIFVSLRELGRIVLAVALVFSMTPHSHAASLLDHNSSMQDWVSADHSHDEDAGIGHHHDEDENEPHDPGHGHGHKVADHNHDKPYVVVIALTPCLHEQIRWAVPAEQLGWTTALAELDRPPRSGFLI